MSNEPQPAWSVEIVRFRQQIDQIEARHREVMAELRSGLSKLERQFAQTQGTNPLPGQYDDRGYMEPYPEPVAEPSVTSVPVEEQLLPALHAAKAASVPPPLPQAATKVVHVVNPPPVVPPPLAKPGETFEQKLGQVWLVRVGIVLLITGLVLGANWAYKNWIHDLPAGVRLAGLYLCAFVIGGVGLKVGRKEGYKRYGEVLVAGGLAFFYYCTFAAHHVERLRVIDSPVAASLLLLGAAGLIAAVSWFRESRTTAVMGILLASYATMIQPLDWLSSTSNLVLAVTGILLMLRPGWSAPGIASLAGTYGAFIGWQLLGAAGQGHGNFKASLWFLPASWAIFAIPGMLGKFRDSLGDYGRAWFTAANNALFFLIFSTVWLANYGPGGFWKVPACFGLVLLAMGLIGRKREDTAAASNVIQALGMLSLAMVLKLDGYYLGLAFAAESLALAVAFHRFRKWAEFVFALISGMAAAVMAIYSHAPEVTFFVPLWSSALAAVLVAGAAVLFRLAVERAEMPRPIQVRSGASLLVYSSLAVLLIGWCFRLPESWQLAVVGGLAVGFAALSLLVDRQRWLPEIAWASGVTGMIAVLFIQLPAPVAAQGFALLAGLGACALWHRAEVAEGAKVWFSFDPADNPRPFAWLFAIFVPLLFARMVHDGQLSDTWTMGALAIGAVALVALARLTRARRLEITATFLNIGALLLVLHAIVVDSQNVTRIVAFAPALAAGAILALVMVRRDEPLLPQVLITRGTLFVAWAAALLFAVPHGFIDLMALSAGIAFFFAWRRKHLAPIDAWGWTVVSLAVYVLVLLEGVGSRFHGYRFEGIGLVALLAGIALQTPKVPASIERVVAKGLPWLACLVLTVWSTHIVVDVFGWKGVSVLWTILGFGLVSFGLVLNRITSRQVGFSLLGLALVKLFAVDVWDFGTFMRVVSFVALGLALVVLGLFYHRFAPALKRLIDEDAAPPTPEEES